MTRSILFSQVARMAMFAADDAAAGGATQAPAKAPEPKTVGNDMESRRIFSNLDDATNYLAKMADEMTDFDSVPLAAAALDTTTGEFDAKVYDGMDVMVSVLSGGKGERKVKAIVVAPIPKIQSVIESPEGLAWATKILHKEMNHVAVRPLRDAADVSTMVDQIPTTMGAYISSQRESSGLLETYNELYRDLNTTFSKKVPVWAKARLTKGELKKALENKAYAEEYYVALENRGEGKDSLFVTALQIAINAAKAKGLDPAIFQRWLDTRNNKTLTAAEDDSDELDLDAMTAEMSAAPAADAPATAPAPAAQ